MPKEGCSSKHVSWLSMSYHLQHARYNWHINWDHELNKQYLTEKKYVPDKIAQLKFLLIIHFNSLFSWKIGSSQYLVFPQGKLRIQIYSFVYLINLPSKLLRFWVLKQWLKTLCFVWHRFSTTSFICSYTIT